MKQQIRVYRANHAAKKPFFRPRLIYKADGRSIVTESKWFPDKIICMRDWFCRGFIVIEDESIGGGFETKYFPVCNLENISNAFALKFKSKDKDKKNDE